MCLYAILSLKINRACTELGFHDSETFFNFPSLLVYTNDFFRPGCLQISTNGVDHFGFLISFIFPFFNKLISTLSAEAIILYSMLLKRTGMSFKNNWIDKEGRVFIYFTVEEIMKRRNISKPTAIKILDELDVKKGIGLIERVRLGLGKPNIIYVKDFMSISEVKETDLLKLKTFTSGSKNSLP